jgi:hypothetical protein
VAPGKTSRAITVVLYADYWWDCPRRKGSTNLTVSETAEPLTSDRVRISVMKPTRFGA